MNIPRLHVRTRYCYYTLFHSVAFPLGLDPVSKSHFVKTRPVSRHAASMIRWLHLDWNECNRRRGHIAAKGLFSFSVSQFVSFSTPPAFLRLFPSFPCSPSLHLLSVCREFDCSVPFTFTHHLLNLAATVNQFLMLAALQSLASSVSLCLHFIFFLYSCWHVLISEH